MPEVRVLPDGDAVVEACTREIVALQSGAPFHLALSGGSTPEALYRRLAKESLEEAERSALECECNGWLPEHP